MKGITVKELLAEVSQNQRDLDRTPVTFTDQTGNTFDVTGWDDSRTDEFNLSGESRTTGGVVGMTPAEKLTRAVSLSNFSEKGKFILKNGNVLFEAMPLPVGTPDKLDMDNMHFEKRTESNGISVYYEI